MILFPELPTDDEIVAEALREFVLESRQAEQDAHHRLRIERRDRGICETCGATEGIRLEPAMTAYHYDGEDPDLDPNREWMACEDCATLNREYWEERWNEYYSGRL